MPRRPRQKKKLTAKRSASTRKPKPAPARPRALDEELNSSAEERIPSASAGPVEPPEPTDVDGGATRPLFGVVRHPLTVVGVGASAGGLEAFSQLLAALPPDLGMAFVLVQHLAPQHESALPVLLGSVSTLPVIQVTEGMRVEPNHVYVIPPNAQLTLVDGELRLSPRATD